LAYRDTAILYAPIRTLVSRSLREGHLPLWNPYEATGKPLFAEGLHGVLHPLSLLAALLDPGGVDLLIALYLVAAALGAFVLARELGLERPHAFLAGAAFSLSGFVVSMTGNLVFLAGAASLPWQAAAVAAVGRGARFAVPVAGLATACTIFSGDAQMAIVAALLGASVAAQRGGWRGAVRAGGATLLGALLASVQILPTLAALEVSARSLGLQQVERLQFALSPWRLVELLVPGVVVRLDGPASSAVFHLLGGPTTTGNDMPFSPSVYLGAPVLVLAACAPLRDRRVKLLAAAAGVFLWLALGHHAGARPALDWIPVWGKFRYTEKLVAPFSLAVALLAGFGARGGEGAGPGRRRGAVAAVACGALAVIAWGVASSLADANEPARALLADNLGNGLPHALLGAAGIAAAALLPLAGPWRSALLGGSVTASLLAAVPFATAWMPRDACHAWPGALEAEPPGPRVILASRTAGIPHPAGTKGIPVQRDVMARDLCGFARAGGASQNVRDGVGTFWGYGGLGSHRLSTMVSALPGQWERGSRRFSVTHASIIRSGAAGELWLRDVATSGGRLVATDRDYGLELHAVPHLPWARFASRAILADGLQRAATAFAWVVEADHDAVVVESDAPVPVGRGAVRSISRGVESLSVEVDALDDALLVINDAWWPGWVARIDGREVPILPANVIARGVVVPAGRHVLTMDYEPPELRLGLLLSALGILAGLALVALESRRRRATRP
jgi:hypothetical protein